MTAIGFMRMFESNRKFRITSVLEKIVMETLLKIMSDS